MHQESWDGINLRFRGIVIYRIIDVERASSLFSFSHNAGERDISRSIGDVCMGELRAIASQMTMDQCIKERKTTITQRLHDAVIPLIEGRDEESGWGIKIDVLQVAQVFCPDEQVLAQLQADARDKIRKGAQFSGIETDKEIHKSKIESQIELAARSLELEKTELQKKKDYEEKKALMDYELKITALEKSRMFEDKKALMEYEMQLSALENRKKLEEKKIATDSELRMRELDTRLELAEKELHLKEMETKIKEIEIGCKAREARQMAEIRKEILPIEQMPAIAGHLSSMFRDSKLTFVGSEHMLFNSLQEMLGMVTGMMKNGHAIENAGEPVPEVAAAQPGV
jgi:regulator of protease activity HflC (stomatin/prohibitin superfamily)